MISVFIFSSPRAFNALTTKALSLCFKPASVNFVFLNCITLRFVAILPEWAVRKIDHTPRHLCRKTKVFNAVLPVG